MKQLLIAIAPAAGYESDDYDLYVYDHSGVQIASSASETGFNHAAP